MGLEENLQRLAEYVAREGRRLGLTNYDTAERVRARLIEPALEIEDELMAERARTVAEIGAGSGAMGLALALALPMVQFVLVDRRDKSVAFVEILAARLALENVRAVKLDLQSKRARLEPAVDAALFRAVAEPEEDLEMAERAVRPSGLAIIWTSFDQPPAQRPGWQHEGRVFTTVAGLVRDSYRWVGGGSG